MGIIVRVGAATTLNTDANNRPLHADEVEWIKDHAHAFAQSTGSSDSDAEQRLALQALKQVDKAREGYLGADTDTSAQAYLQQGAKSQFTNADGAQQPQFTAIHGEQYDGVKYAADIASNPVTAQWYQRTVQPGIVYPCALDALSTAAALSGATQDSVIGAGHALGGAGAALNPEVSGQLQTRHGQATAPAVVGTIAASPAAAMALPIPVGRASELAADAVAGTVKEVAGPVADGGAETSVSVAGPSTALIGTETDQLFNQASKAEPVKPSPSGNISLVKNCAYGFCTSAQTAEEQALIKQIQAGKDINGSLTEHVLESAAKREGYQVLDGGKYGSNNGFDLVLQHPDGSVTIIAEGKQMKYGSFQLAEGAGGQIQLTNKWVDTVIRSLPLDSPARLAVKNAIELQRLKTVVGGVDRTSGRITLTPVKFPSSKKVRKHRIM